MEELARFHRRFHRHFTRDPNERLHLGVDRDLGDLPDPSLGEIRSRLDEARDLEKDLEAIPTEPLGFDDRLDLDLARLMLGSEIHRGTLRFNGKTRAEQSPEAGDAIGAGLLMLSIRDPRPDEERLADATARLEQVPDFLEGMLARLDTPVRRWVSIDVEKMRALPELFRALRRWAGSVGWDQAGRLESASERAVGAVDEYVRRLEARSTTHRFQVGTEAARRIVELRGIEQPLEDLHRMAVDFLAETRATLDELRERLARKYALDGEATITDVSRFLGRRFAVEAPDDDFELVLDRYRRELDRIIEFIRNRDLFPLPEDQEIRILRTPPFLTSTIPAGAMVSPAPFRQGTKQSLVYLTLSQKLLEEHTTIRIPGMMLHEGIPGHHLQFTFAAMHPSVIRRHCPAMDQSEGWTTMLEDYLLDAGLMDGLTDEARFAGKREIARIGARVAIDLFFMTGNRAFLEVGAGNDPSPEDPFAAAGHLLRAVTGFTAERAEGELNWYSREPGYPLCYLTGNRLVWQLRRDFEQAQSAGRSGAAVDRAFHEAFLRAGSMPVSRLRRLFEHQGLLGGSPRASGERSGA